jgi:hypothetical protein
MLIPRLPGTGQTTTWTGSSGPFPCSALPTCTCVLPGGTQTASVCPASVTCTGQTTTWTANQGPSVCPASVTCHQILPSSTGKAGASGSIGGSSSLAGAGGVQMGAILVAVFALFGGLL